MWSAIAIRRPGPTSALRLPAALVIRIASAPWSLEPADRDRHALRVAGLVDVLAALEDGDVEAVRACPGAASRRGRRRSAAGSPRARCTGCRSASVERVRDPAQAGAEDDPEPHVGRNSGPKERGSSSSSVAVIALAGGADMWISAPGTMNSRSRWRQPPHGHAGRLAVGDHGDLGDALAARGDERADRGRLGALALRVGGVLDVGADVDRAVLGPQRRADAVVAVRRVGALHDLAGGVDERAAADHLVAVGVAQDALRRDLERLGEAGDLLELVGEVGVGGRDALELDEVPEVLDLVEVDAHRLPEQQVALLLDHREHAEARLQRGAAASAASSTGIEPVARLARLVGVHPVVLDERGAPGLLLAQLQAALLDAEVGVALLRGRRDRARPDRARRPASARGPGRTP